MLLHHVGMATVNMTSCVTLVFACLSSFALAQRFVNQTIITATAGYAIDECNPPVQCVAGRKLANPNDCRSYYVCDRTHRQWRYVRCAGEDQSHLYFDVRIEACVSRSEAVCRKKCQGERVIGWI